MILGSDQSQDWLGDVGALDVAVGVGHALVQSLQGEVGGVIWLLQEDVAYEEIIRIQTARMEQII